MKKYIAEFVGTFVLVLVACVYNAYSKGTMSIDEIMSFLGIEESIKNKVIEEVKKKIS